MNATDRPLSRNEFATLHDGNPIPDGDHSWILPDGARVQEGSERGLDTYFDPPSDPSAAIRERRRYIKLLLKGKEAAFLKFKNEWFAQANHARTMNVPPPPASCVEQLEAGVKEIQSLQAQLRAMDEEIAKLPQTALQRQREATQREQDHAATELMNRIAAVTYEGEPLPLSPEEQATQDRKTERLRESVRRTQFASRLLDSVASR